METPHHVVHSAAHSMLDHIHRAWQTNVDIQHTIYAQLERMEEGSLQVMEVIDRMVAEKHGGELESPPPSHDTTVTVGAVKSSRKIDAPKEGSGSIDLF